MNKTISLLIPTRGRPLFMDKVAKSAIYMAENKFGVQVVFYIDTDDYHSIMKARGLKVELDTVFGEGTIKYIVGVRIVLSQMWNECYKLSDADICMHCGDDIVFETDKWDSVVLSAFGQYEDKILFAYGSDGLQPDTFGTHGFIHRNWVNTVGYFVPPYFSSDYNDTWLNEVSEMIGRKKHIPIFTEHIHPAAGKHFWDETHQDRLRRHEGDKVTHLYNEMYPNRVADAQKLKVFIDSFVTA